jgi:hypothetical protein
LNEKAATQQNRGQDGAARELNPFAYSILDATCDAAYPIVAEAWSPAEKVKIRSDFRAFGDRFSSEQEIIQQLSVR